MALRLVGEETSGGGGAPTGASYVTTAAEAGLSAELVLGSAVIMSGTLAARPAAGTAGRLYFATDDDGGTLARDTGAAWVNLAAGLTEVLADAVVPTGVMRDAEHAADAHAQTLTGPVTRLRTGTAAARPATGNTEGDVWWATDTNVLSLWDGAAWVQVYPGSGGAHQLSRVVRTAEGAYSTTSATFVDIDTANLAITLTITAGRWVRLVLQGTINNLTVSAQAQFDFTVGGVRQGQGQGIAKEHFDVAASPNLVHIEWVYQETTGGSITFRPQWATDTGTLQFLAGTATTPLLFFVEEIPV